MDVSALQERFVEHPEELVRIPMSFDEWWGLPDEIHSEWVDGIAIMTPPAGAPHSRAEWMVPALIHRFLPDLDLHVERGAHTAPTRYRIPDVAAYAERQESPVAEEPPVIAVEILSPSTRREDTFRKTGEYQRAGVQQYWLLDPVERTLTVLDNNGADWDIVLELDDDHPAGEVAVGDHGTIALSLDELLG